VFDRKSKPARVGSELDRPTLLMKGEFVRDTSFSEEVLNKGTDF